MLTSVLIGKDAIRARIKTLAEEIDGQMACGEDSFDLLWLAEGAFIFAADLARELHSGIRVHSLKVSSYGDRISSGGVARYNEDFSKFKGRRVLLADDILDTGTTARAIVGELKKCGAKCVKTCFLLDKKNGLEKKIKPDFVGFEIPNLYVFGYGLDHSYNLRNLPEICVAKK